MENRSPMSPTIAKVRKIKIGPLIPEHKGFLLDDTLSISEEDFDVLLEYLDGMNIHIKVLKKGSE